MICRSIVPIDKRLCLSVLLFFWFFYCFKWIMTWRVYLQILFIFNTRLCQTHACFPTARYEVSDSCMFAVQTSIERPKYLFNRSETFPALYLTYQERCLTKCSAIKFMSGSPASIHFLLVGPLNLTASIWVKLSFLFSSVAQVSNVEYFYYLVLGDLLLNLSSLPFIIPHCPLYLGRSDGLSQLLLFLNHPRPHSKTPKN